ncbi:SusC/RagA family TonB-linked outer membrane protein [Spongiimicrobium sp. 3-5]|uniref:SusC/RagA family TonB-linked outer membrane protein n=1 Tax=Spongiimicrobium sp. 3-5 TaxID=3332596 RepID=UPI00397FE964
MSLKINCHWLKPKRNVSCFKIRFFSILICLGVHWTMASAETKFEVNKIVQSTVTGTITDASGAPLPGVNILVKGTTNGTQTDFDGNYSIVAAENAVLVFSYIGFSTQEIPVNGQSVINAALEEDASQLDEVVVTGYTTQSKTTVTGAMSQVDVEEALAVPIQNAGQALQGRASGVTVVGGGQPGSTPLIRIRGLGTTNNNGPLIIIDGVQTTDGSILSQINPNDIQAINILKDGSAAIYGARASNGVVIVTTKSGTRDEKPKLSFNSYIGFQQLAKSQDVLNAQQLGEVLFESFINDGVAPTHPQYGSGATPVIPEFIRGSDAQPYDEINNKITRSADTDWLDEIFQTALIQNYDVSIRGGNQKSRYLMSVGYQNVEGIQIHTGFERLTTRLNAEFDITDNIRVGEHLNIGFTDQLEQNQFGNALRMPPLVPVFDEGGNFGGGGPSTAAGLSNVSNPVAELTRGRDNFDRRFRIFGDVYTEITILDDFKFKSTYGFTINDRLDNDISRANPEAPEPKTNALTELNSRATSWVWSNTLRWDKIIGNHNFQILGGIEAVSDEFRVNETRVQNFLLEDTDFFVLGAGTGTPSIIDSRLENSTLFSYLFNLNYSFKDRYLASFSLRRDKTSRFSDGNNTGVFPSISLGWAISDENFFREDGLLSFLKLRASYGELGNQDVPVPNPNVNILEAQQEIGFYPINGGSVATGAVLSALGTPDLQWETSQQLNVGVDVRFFDNALGFSLDYFNNTTRDMIIQSPLPSTAIDASAPFINGGEVNNKGVDITLNYTNANQESVLKWDVGINFSAYKNELVKVNGDNPNAFINGSTFRSGVITRSSNGLPISHFFGRDVVGIFQNAAEVSAAPDQGFATPEDGVGRFRYRDVDNNGTINDDDRAVLGDPHPDFTYGINANLSYKKFFLTLFLQGVQGNEVYNFSKIESDFPTFLNSNRSTRVVDSWRPDNPNAILPALSTSIKNNESQPNSYFVEDGSYLRLRNLQIGYDFEASFLGLSSARLYIQGTNLFTITNYLGADPEIGNTVGDEPNSPSADLTIGVDNGNFPQPRSYILGLNVTF